MIPRGSRGYRPTALHDAYAWQNLDEWVPWDEQLPFEIEQKQKDANRRQDPMAAWVSWGPYYKDTSTISGDKRAEIERWRTSVHKAVAGREGEDKHESPGSSSTKDTSNGSTAESAKDAWAYAERKVNPKQPFPQTWCPLADEGPARLTTYEKDGRVAFLRGREIGAGGWAVAYKVYRMRDGTILCGKTVQQTHDPKVAAEMLQKLKHESQVLQRQCHEHLLQHRGFFEDESPEKAMLLTEFCNGGNLDEFIHHHAVGGMKPEDIVRALHQVSSALEYLHRKSLYHTDVKPKNIFIRCVKPFNVVLGDCADIQPTSYKGKLLGTKLFHSPYVVRWRANCGPSDDIWALGISALAMIDMSPKVMYNVLGPRRKDVKVDYDEYPARCGTHALSLRQVNKGNPLVKVIQKMLEIIPTARFRASDVRQIMEGQLDKWEGKTLNITPPEGFQQVAFW